MKLIATLVSLVTFGVVLAQEPTTPLAVLKGHTADVDVVTKSSQGFIATGSADFKVNIYKMDSPYQLVKTLGGHMGPITALAYNKNGKMLATGGEDRLIQLFDSTLKVGARLEAHKDRINFLLFDQAGRYLYSGSDDKTIIVWDTKTGKAVKTITQNQAISAIATTPDFKLIYVAASEPKINLINTQTGLTVKSLTGHTDAVNDIAITPNGKWMISGSNDKTARVWDLTTGKQLRILPVDCWKVLTVSISDDGQYATTGCNDGSIKVWELATGKLINSIIFVGGIARSVQFANGNNQILAGFMLHDGTDFGIRIYDSKIELPKPIKSPTANQVADTVKTQKSSKPEIPPANKPKTPAPNAAPKKP